MRTKVKSIAYVCSADISKANGQGCFALSTAKAFSELGDRISVQKILICSEPTDGNVLDSQWARQWDEVILCRKKVARDPCWQAIFNVQVFINLMRHKPSALIYSVKPFSIFALVYCYITSAKMIVLLEGLGLETLRKLPFKALHGIGVLVLRNAIRSADLVIAAYPEAVKWAECIREGKVGANSVVLAWCGVESSFARSRPDLCKSSGNYINIGYCGSMRRVHRVDLAIKLVSENDDFRLHVAGEGAQLESMRRMAEDLGVEERVNFYGSLERGAVIEMMTRMHFMWCYVDDTCWGYPIKLHESIVAGVHGICGTKKAYQQMVRKGWLIDYGEELSAKLRSCLGDKERYKEQSVEMRKYGQKMFDWGKYTESIRDALEC